MATHHRRQDRRASSNVSSSSAAQQKHDQLMRVYRDTQTHASTSNKVADYDLAVLQRHFQFIRDDEADLERGERDWEVRMSVRYYRKLFREYALADLSRYREGKVGLRWRTEREVVIGKGQFVCGNKVCDERVGLHSYELLFAYVEQGEKKRCLVKVRVCEACARKLFYRKLKENDKQRKKRRAREREEDEEQGETMSKKRKQRHHDQDDEQEKQESVHTRCSEINAVETRGLRRPDDETTSPVDEREKSELAQLLL